MYQHLTGGRYHYESGGGSFTAELETRPDGFVTHYSGLWIAESSA